MSRDPIVTVSKKMSWLLRHGAKEAGVALDAAGWANVNDVLRVLGITQKELEQAVASNDKKRFELSTLRIRAVQGHSLPTIDSGALEDSWEEYREEGSVWHGTRLHALEGIARKGLLAQGRSHVHLAATVDSHVGKRSGVDVLLEVSTKAVRENGFTLWRAPNGVILARHVPSQCIVGVLPVSHAAQARVSELATRWPVVGRSNGGGAQD